MEGMKPDKLIRLSKSCLGEAEKLAVLGVLDREYLGMGAEVKQFEQALTERPRKQALQGEIVVPSLGLPCLGERFPGWCAGLPGRTFWTTYGKCQLRAVCRLGPFGAGGLPTAHWSVCMWGVPGVASCRGVTYRG